MPPAVVLVVWLGHRFFWAGSAATFLPEDSRFTPDPINRSDLVIEPGRDPDRLTRTRGAGDRPPSALWAALFPGSSVGGRVPHRAASPTLSLLATGAGARGNNPPSGAYSFREGRHDDDRHHSRRPRPWTWCATRANLRKLSDAALGALSDEIGAPR